MGEDLERFCAVIPAYNEQARLGPVVEAAAAYVDTVIVVDDGSADATSGMARAAGALVVRHEVNKGKGAALATGLARAVEDGFVAAVTLDADGQHDPAEIPRFIDEFRVTRADVVVGTRMGNRAGMPFIRAATNLVTSAIISVIAGRRLTDCQSGFRLLKCATAARLPVAGARFDAEAEMLVKAARSGFVIVEVPVRTIYGAEKSKINPLRDTCRFVLLIVRLVFFDR